MDDNERTGADSTLLEKIAASIPNGFMIFDAETGLLKSVNGKGALIFGQPVEALIGLEYGDFFDTPFARPVSNREQVIKKKDGTEAVLLRNSSHFRHGEGSFVLESFIDITGRKLSEGETREQLEKALKKADSANRSKSNFLASMSHEIRTPINGIIGFLTLLKESNLTREQLDYCSNAEKSSRILLALINDILDFSKIEAGKLDIEKIPFNIYDAVEETALTFAVGAEEKNDELFVNIQTDVPPVCVGDPNRFRQILMNLCSNAVKFTRNGDIEITVSLLKKDKKTVTLRVDVADEGIGIAEDKLTLIFSSFTQAASSVAREYGGSGLGLTISKQLVKMLGGELRAESVEGKGSRFSFFINFLRAPEREGLPETRRLSGQKVLIYGKKDKSISLLRGYAAEWGMEAETKDGSGGGDENRGYSYLIVDTSVRWFPETKLINDLLGKCDKNVRIILLLYPGKIAACRHLEKQYGVIILPKPVRKLTLLNELLRPSEKSAGRDGDGDGDGETLSRSTREDAEHGDRKEARKFHVLIAEDNKINLKLTARILEKNGYSFDGAVNGREALELYQKNKYDLVLMDCLMPEMDGYLSTLKIRQLEKKNGNPRTPIIALTANAMKGERQKVLSAGMDDYLAKPVEPNTLLQVMNKWLNSAGPSFPPLRTHERRSYRE